MQFIKPDININFMGRRNLFLMISGVLMLLSLLPILVMGLNYGIDFAGGILAQVKFKQPVQAEQIRAALPAALSDAVVQSFGAEEDNEFLIRSQGRDFSLDTAGAAIQESLNNAFGEGNADMRRVETVGPKAGKDLREKALMAIFFSILLMGIYISGRFESKWVLSCLMAIVLGLTAFVMNLVLVAMGVSEDIALVVMIIVVMAVTFLVCIFLRLRYATGAVVSIVHDALLTVGIYCLLGREFNLTTVAALLTIIGFSVNDTIIIYDRIRENLRKGVRKSFVEVINQSINQTLSRTILTSGTLLIVVVILFFFGGGVIEDFALTMIIGVVVATYSSIYIASPLLLLVPESRKKAATSAAKPVRRAKNEDSALESDSDESAGEAAKKVRKRRVNNRSRRR